MKNQILLHKPSVSDFAAFCFFAGILLGTVWANLEGGEDNFQVMSFFFRYGSAGGEVLAGLILKRWLLAGVLWLTGMSLLAVPGILIFLVWAGFSMAFLISGLTVQSGVAGLALFAASVIPQIFLYLPVIAVLSSWALNRCQKLHLAGFLVLLVLTAAGAAAEAYLNPALFFLISEFFS